MKSYPMTNDKASGDLVERLLAGMEHGLELDRDMTFWVHGNGPGAAASFPLEYRDVLAAKTAGTSLRTQLAAAEAAIKEQNKTILLQANALQTAKTALEELSAKVSTKIAQLEDYRENHCILDHAKTIADERIQQANQIQHWIAEALRSLTDKGDGK